MNSLPVDYSLLMRELHQRAAERRQPAIGTFELTSRCNLACKMCYVRHPEGNRALRDKELPPEAWHHIAEEALQAGVVFLLLTGGEVFVRSDFFEIYEPLTRMGFVLNLFTNGTLITNEIAEKLAQAPPDRTEITIYGATAEVYESISGVPGSYAACCSGIEALLAQGVPLALKSTLTRYNIGELEAMRQMSRNWGLPFSAAWMIFGRPDRTPSAAKACRLSAAECVELEATDQASAHEWTEVAFREPNPTSKKSHANFQCQAGKAAFSINPSGEMNTCQLLPLPAAPTLGIGFHEAWYQLQRYVDSAPSPASECLGCNERAYCARCPAWSFMENGTLTEPVPYLCEIARERKNYYAGGIGE